MRAVTSITDSEVKAYQAFVEATPGLVNDTHNAELIGGAISQLDMEINAATLKMTFDSLQDKLHLISAAELAFNKIASIFSASQLEVFNILYSQQRLVRSGDQAFENKAALLEQLRGRTIARQTMLEAVGRIANNSTRRLHVLPPEVQAEPFGVHSQKKFEVQESAKLTVDDQKTWDDQAKFVGGKLNHAHNPKLQPAKPAEPTQNFWQGKAEAVQGDRAHETDQLRRIFITHNGLKMNAYSDAVDWKQTFEAREAAYKLMVRAKERGI